MKKLILGLVLCLSMAIAAQAGIPITVDNHSFEAPIAPTGGGDSNASWNWNNQDSTDVDVITDWNYDYTAAPWPSDNDTGVVIMSSATDGLNAIFCRHSAAAAANQLTGPWQDLGYTIVAGETYAFKIDVRRHDVPNDDHAVSLTFNYHDGVNPRVEIIENVIDITGQAGDTWKTYSVFFTATAGADYIGKSLGVEFNNESDNDSWHSFDNARVEQPFVSGFNPEDGASTVQTDTNLSWALEASVTNCDVYFGTDPNVAANPMVVDGQTQGKVTTYPPAGGLALDSGTPYYWRVDARVGTTVYEGDTYTFTTAIAEPVITAQPESLTVDAGDTAVFMVEAVNATEYSWKKLSDGSEVGTESTLTITNVQKADEDVYYCVASNETDATATSDKANLMTRRLVALWEFEDDLNAKDDEDAACWPGDYTDPNELAPSPTPVFDAGVVGKALVLTADELHVRITGSNDFFNFYPLGYSTNVWINTAQTDWGCMASKQSEDTSLGWTMYCGGGDIWQGIRGVGSVASDVNINDSQWHMVTATYDAQAGVITTYIDGEPAGANTSTDVALTNEYPVIFGTESMNGTTNCYEGLLDEIRIYSYSLSQIDVALLYTDVTGGSICLEYPRYDLNGDCRVDVIDFAEFAADWLECGIVPTCLP